MKIKDKYKDKINVKFYYYYLKQMQTFIEEHYQLGSCNKHLDIDNFNKMLIPLSSIEYQNEIVKNMDAFDDMIKISNEFIEKQNEIIKIYVNPMIDINQCEIKKIRDICNSNSTTKYNSSIGKKSGSYKFYNSSQNNILYLDTFEIDRESIIIGNGGNGCIHYDFKFTPSKHVSVFQVKDNKKIECKYIYYYILSNMKQIDDIKNGSTINWINKTNINNIEIKIPIMETQREIIKNCDKINKIIDELNEQNKFYEQSMNNIGTKIIFTLYMF